MNRWWERPSGAVRDRLSSVVVATVLAALIVFGVLAVLIFAVRGAQTDYSAAQMAVSVAAVTEDAIATTASLQEDRALGSMVALQPISAYRAAYEDSVARSDADIQDLRVTWSRNRANVPESATPPVSDVLASEVTLADIRAAAASPRGESTFDLYTELVELSLSATLDLVKQTDDPLTAANRVMIGALLTASEAMHNQRHLLLTALASGEPLSEELFLQLDVVSDNIDQSLVQARSLASGSDLEAIEQIIDGAEAEQVDTLMTEIVESEDGVTDVTVEEWFEAGAGRIEQVDDLIPQVNADETATARDNLDGARRTLWTRAILLGALFILTTLVASSAVNATRERGEALAEYRQLTDGLREWFVPTAFPDSENVEITARYVPASVRTMSGGDWYDVYQVGEALAVVIGDIAGHGADASAQMAQLRNVLRGQSTARPLAPAAQIDLLSRTMADSGIVATLTYGLLNPASGEFVYTRAGHIPLMVRSAAGSVRIEEEAGGPPVGSGVDVPHGQMVTRLQPGDVLILITDGLVEGIDRDIDVAFDEIAKALTEVALSAEAALDELFDLNEAQTIDDAAALLITWKGRQRGPASSDSGGGDPAP
jgi:hypothetical protein